MTDNERSDSPTHDDDHFHRDSGYGHDLFMLRPISQMELAGGPPDKVLLLMWEDDDECNVFVKNTQEVQKWVRPAKFGTRRVAWKKNGAVVGPEFQWNNKTGMFRTNKFICALAGTSLKEALTKLDHDLADHDITSSWVGTSKPDLNILDHKITFEFRLVRTPQSRHPHSVELAGDIYMLGDTQYLRAYMDLELQDDLNWAFVRAEFPYWKLTRDERSKDPYNGSFKKVLDKIEQAALTHSTKPTFRWMYMWSDDGNLTRMTAAELPQPQVESFIMLHLIFHTCRLESTEMRPKHVIHHKPQLGAQ